MARYDTEEQRELDRKALELNAQLNREIDQLGKTIDEFTELLRKGARIETVERGGEEGCALASQE